MANRQQVKKIDTLKSQCIESVIYREIKSNYIQDVLPGNVVYQPIRDQLSLVKTKMNTK